MNTFTFHAIGIGCSAAIFSGGMALVDAFGLSAAAAMFLGMLVGIAIGILGDVLSIFRKWNDVAQVSEATLYERGSKGSLGKLNVLHDDQTIAWRLW
jgi:hypothetical protein